MTGASQWELDQLSSACDDSEGEPRVSSSPVRARETCDSHEEEETDPMRISLHAANRRKRISFSGMTAELASVQESEIDIRGGLSQAALDALMVDREESETRDDSPVSTALRRKKRSRVSVGGAGRENMLIVASESLEEVLPKSPLKFAQDSNCNIENQSQSPSKKRLAGAEKLETTTPLGLVNA
mmetsp:Transcript_123216/g.192458  ORF Transcript_123216/g.192458 Transcript_123216/m.192458 type:complete len:185 (+) Transcript_123216:67-621(+)